MSCIPAIGYLRVSTVEQAQHALSIPDQKNKIAEYAARNGYDIIAIYEEPGASGRDDQRPVFTKMMDRAALNPPDFSAILVHSMSRFMRDELLCEFWYRKLQKSGIDLISITQDFGKGPVADLTRRLMAIIDEMNSKENAKHVHRTMLENARQGFWNGSVAPLGFRTIGVELRGDKQKKKLEIDPLHEGTIKLIYRLYLEGDGEGPLGMKNITTHLNTHGLTTRQGKRFHQSYIESILKDEVYAGRFWYNRRDTVNEKVRPKEEWIGLSVPQIVSEQDFQRVQTQLALRSPKVTAPRAVNGPTLLLNIARCGKCGAPMGRRTGKGGRYAYYRCSEFLRSGICDGDRGTAINADTLDTLVLTRVCELLLSAARVQEIVGEVAVMREAGVDTAANSLRQLREQLSKSKKKHSRLLNALGEGEIDPTEMFRQTLRQTEGDTTRLVGLIAAQERVMERRVNSISLAQAALYADRLREKLMSGSAAVQKRIVRSIIQEVIVGDDEIAIVGAKSDFTEVVTGGKKNGQ